MDKIKQTVTINGRVFDVRTGRPVVAAKRTANPSQAHHNKKQTRIISDFGPKRAAPTPHKAKPSSVQTITKPQSHKNRAAAPHRTQKLQKSTTLRRDLLAKPAQAAKTNVPRRRRHVAQSALVSRFANKSPVEKENAHVKKHDKEIVAQHAILHRAHQEHVVHQAIAAQPVHPKEVKEQLLANQLSKSIEVTNSHAKTPKQLSKKQRLTGMLLSGFALLIVGGYLTYSNIPNLSIRVASSNAGIDASLPRYQPSGYRINGPIAYTNGEVAVKYKQAGSTDMFTLTQRTSDWDPQATLDNYVEPESRDNYEIHSAQGLTVYTYGKKAVWVNGGILHIIEGTAKLSSQQIERIAASM